MMLGNQNKVRVQGKYLNSELPLQARDTTCCSRVGLWPLLHGQGGRSQALCSRIKTERNEQLLVNSHGEGSGSSCIQVSVEIPFDQRSHMTTHSCTELGNVNIVGQCMGSANTGQSGE